MSNASHAIRSVSPTIAAPASLPNLPRSNSIKSRLLGNIRSYLDRAANQSGLAASSFSSLVGSIQRELGKLGLAHPATNGTRGHSAAHQFPPYRFLGISPDATSAAAAALAASAHGNHSGTDSALLHDRYALITDTEVRSAVIRAEFLHAWQGYADLAFGHDELRPESNIVNDSWGGFGATLIDALDTMMLMGLDAQVARARAHVARLNFDKDVDMSFFETTIRLLGGLLGAWELSRDPVYLTQARALGDRLIVGLDATATGLPQSVINLRTGRSHNHGWTGGASILAEVGSCQLEFAQLSRATGDPTYAVKSRCVACCRAASDQLACDCILISFPFSQSCRSVSGESTSAWPPCRRRTISAACTHPTLARAARAPRPSQCARPSRSAPSATHFTSICSSCTCSLRTSLHCRCRFLMIFSAH